MLTYDSMYSAIQSVSAAGSVTCSSDLAGTAAGIATGIFYPCGIAALENYLNNYYNISVIQNNTKKTTIKSRLLAQTQNHNPHYHNDPELKEIIDKLNQEAIKKYQKTHEPYEQLQELAEKNRKKTIGGNDAQPLSTIEKELLETYKEMFGNESDMLNSGMSPNIDVKSSTCECTDINNIKLGKTKGRDKLLCECDLYIPNYDNDPQMKKIMENFDRQTSQRFHEYDDRMKTTRQKCKDKCDKEIQKIILKYKLEKQMKQELTTLETKITTDDIPTCVCEKSIADKVEKGCLRCAGVLGGGVAPSIGLLGGIGEAAISVLKPLALDAAKDAAVTEATALATKAGIEAVKLKIQGLMNSFTSQACVDLTKIVTPSTFDNGTALVETAEKLIGNLCVIDNGGRNSFYTTAILYDGPLNIKGFAKAGRSAFETTFAFQKGTLETAKVGAVEATYGGYHISIIASIVAIVVIVLIMVIIYLILRYRRKKKMKKKFQYIKLLEE
ncbi:hypothetical protein PFTANZ_06216 [Plasmodium falciparum Tanzania (2000708)]|uniref:Surface antigen n=1 Tax=Plasmodium falciparum Tanzania (2000708) TaxID=1036725 RepID=A0A024VYR6_PLAFA|nr:hypothetical protein PFTANZ_06216 [Plasmodium falciparum Tanzania (2000708)]